MAEWASDRVGGFISECPWMFLRNRAFVDLSTNGMLLFDLIRSDGEGQPEADATHRQSPDELTSSHEQVA